MKTSANGSAKLTGMCGSCPAFVMSADNRTGNCHENPPMPFLVPHKDANGKVMTDEQGQVMFVWMRQFPSVYPDVDWCLQHPWWKDKARGVEPSVVLDHETMSRNSERALELAKRICAKHGVVDCVEVECHQVAAEEAE
jgi:hypothetical protein